MTSQDRDWMSMELKQQRQLQGRNSFYRKKRFNSMRMNGAPNLKRRSFYKRRSMYSNSSLKVVLEANRHVHPRPVVKA
eukprot:UN01024